MIDKHEAIRSLPLFASYPEALLTRIARRAEVVTYPRGETIGREGEPATSFLVVLSGRVAVSVRVEGTARLVGTLHRGDTIGEVPLLSDEPHFATYSVVNDVVGLRIDRQGFLEIARTIPEFALAVSRNASSRLRRLHAPAPGGPTGGQIVAVFSAAGGVGKSRFAANLAASLILETGRPVALVDAAPAAAGAPPPPGGAERTPLAAWADLAFRGGEAVVDRTVAHTAGFHVLAVGLGDEGGVERVVPPLLGALAPRYAFTVLDLPSRMDAVVFECLRQADRILVLTDTNGANLDRTRNLLGKLPDGARAAVLLTFLRKDEMDRLGEWEERLGTSVAAALRDSPDLAAPEGPDDVPYVLRDPGSPYARSVRHVARWIGDCLVGLVLSSGAARGLAHIGVLKVLEREKILVDIVAGSSIGGLIAAAWATGKHSRHLTRIARSVHTKRRFFDYLDLAFPPSPGLLRGRRVEDFLRRLYRRRTFADVQMPVKVVASDLETSEEVVLDRGPLWAAVRASISIPGIFRPFEHQGRTLVDGAVTDPVPVRVLRAGGVRKIIAVNVIPSPDAVRREVERRRLRRSVGVVPEPEGPPPSLLGRLLAPIKRALFDTGRRDVPNVLDVIVRANQFMEAEMAEVACRQADVVLRPWAPELSWLDFDLADRFIEVGAREAQAHLEALRDLSRRAL